MGFKRGEEESKATAITEDAITGDLTIFHDGSISFTQVGNDFEFGNKGSIDEAREEGTRFFTVGRFTFFGRRKGGDGFTFVGFVGSHGKW